MAWNLVDMELHDEDQFDMPEKMRYPPGLRICLTHEEIDRLGLDRGCKPGDYIHIQAFATVTAVNLSEDACRVELQIEKLAVEDELEEVGED